MENVKQYQREGGVIMKQEDYMWDYRNPYSWMQKVRDNSLAPLIITCAITGGV